MAKKIKRLNKQILKTKETKMNKNNLDSKIKVNDAAQEKLQRASVFKQENEIAEQSNTSKKKRGRPSVVGKNRDQKVMLSLTIDELNQLKAAMEIDGYQFLSTYLRDQVVLPITKDKLENKK